MVVVQVRSDLFDHVAGVVIHRSAAFAHQVELFVGVDDLPTSRFVDAQLRPTSKVELLEECERTVDRRPVDGGVIVVDSGCDLLGGEMTICTVKDRPDQPAGAGEPITLVVEGQADLGVRLHLPMVESAAGRCDPKLVANRSQIGVGLVERLAGVRRNCLLVGTRA